MQNYRDKDQTNGYQGLVTGDGEKAVGVAIKGSIGENSVEMEWFCVLIAVVVKGIYICNKWHETIPTPHTFCKYQFPGFHTML